MGHAWIHQAVKFFSAQIRGLKQGDSVRFYHKQLTAILKSLVNSKEKLKTFANNSVQKNENIRIGNFVRIGNYHF